MDIKQVFFQRYDVLYDFWLGSIWETVPEDLLRQRPHPRVNSMAWNLWHLTRVEDAGVNRFVVDRPQVLDEGGWMVQMDLPWRHHGSGMSFAEVDELDQRIDLQALRRYSGAVRERTREVVAQIDQVDLDAVLSRERAQMIVIDEGLAHPQALDLVDNYTGWSKGKCLLNFALTHPYQHVGEIGVIASLLGVDFD
jgi:hypothetical protein